MTLIDSNIFMYAAGGPHPHRRRSEQFLERVVRGKVEAVIDVEVLQEILHRYRAIQRWDEGRIIYDAARVMFTEPILVTREVLDGARHLLDDYPHLTARDAVHAAVVQLYRLQSICSFDRDFDKIAGVRRIEP